MQHSLASISHTSHLSLQETRLGTLLTRLAGEDLDPVSIGVVDEGDVLGSAVSGRI